jgi:hypothetical protein
MYTTYSTRAQPQADCRASTYMYEPHNSAFHRGHHFNTPSSRCTPAISGCTQQDQCTSMSVHPSPALTRLNDSTMTPERASSSPHVNLSQLNPHPVVQQVAKTQYTTRGHGNQTWVSTRVERGTSYPLHLLRMAHGHTVYPEHTCMPSTSSSTPRADTIFFSSRRAMNQHEYLLRLAHQPLDRTTRETQASPQLSGFGVSESQRGSHRRDSHAFALSDRRCKTPSNATYIHSVESCKI